MSARRATRERGDRFVVHRHRARRLHYDLRLEVGGLLASWAVPKGPTLDPKARQLAVQVEDHPIEYFDFEGVIPSGQYGGGDVIVWDWGTWQPAEGVDPARAIERGELHFDLRGQKLAGRFVLIRRDTDRRGRDNWLLIHKNDDHARRGWDPEQLPRSVKTGRTNDEVAAAPEALWRSGVPAGEAELRLAAPARRWEPPTADELAALDAIDREGRWAVGGRRVKVTNLDKVLFPGRDGEPPVTKRELIRYYARIAPFLLPYLADRPVNANRYPDGVAAPGFWHKEVPDHAPDWLTRWHNTEADPDETQCYAVLDSVPALVWMANFAGIELHPWTSRLPDVHQPTWALIDIDPGATTRFDDLVELARLYRDALDHLDVAGMPKVTGKRGIQIWIPVRPGYTFADTRTWVETVSRVVGRILPDLVSWQWYRNQRSGRARLDYTQNAINKTLVAPFSTRPAPGAPVSVPITWDELDDPDLRPDRWTIRTVLDRVHDLGDPLAPLIGNPQDLPSLTD
ncbi:MAG TPA: DNA polymerase ligase N-terminal domain-containing protein [Actinophytocola sp.]|uniref:non-homologous end-joining DNA ligase LigD n=1 Tax=Actinophytocola sp. TaxID=1872138 RepID=UPI002DDD6255|nr:DNA polymerase ligase N-terminal domain-containing protein [Actinophytocola sp.]HEV2781293.1 DNA polymerase ligase N-terminal domain-containing protein [Actinophytocola sp.]